MNKKYKHFTKPNLSKILLVHLENVYLMIKIKTVQTLVTQSLYYRACSLAISPVTVELKRALLRNRKSAKYKIKKFYST